MCKGNKPYHLLPIQWSSTQLPPMRLLLHHPRRLSRYCHQREPPSIPRWRDRPPEWRYHSRGALNTEFYMKSSFSVSDRLWIKVWFCKAVKTDFRDQLQYLPNKNYIAAPTPSPPPSHILPWEACACVLVFLWDGGKCRRHSFFSCFCSCWVSLFLCLFHSVVWIFTSI